MAWKYPSSTSTTDAVAISLGTQDSLFVDEDVLIFSQSNYAVLGTGSNQTVEISGVVSSGYLGMSLGTFEGSETNGNAVFVDIGGKITSTYAAALVILGNGNLLVNDGEISSSTVGVYLQSDVAEANRLINHGTIEGDEYGISGAYGVGYTILRNSGRIEGTIASYGYQEGVNINTIDIIHNRGTMVGSVYLWGNDDIYHGEKGKLVGSVSGGDGNDQIYDGAGGHTLDGGDGDDTIYGGAGADRIIGGFGEEYVIYNKVSDSTFKNPDIIVDLTESHLDSIDLRDIDANSKKDGNQDWVAGSHKIGGLWWEFANNKMIIYAETDGDKQPDLKIVWLDHFDQLYSGEFLI